VIAYGCTGQRGEYFPPLSCRVLALLLGHQRSIRKRCCQPYWTLSLSRYMIYCKLMGLFFTSEPVAVSE
jgi:hypothetical protein